MGLILGSGNRSLYAGIHLEGEKRGRGQGTRDKEKRLRIDCTIYIFVSGVVFWDKISKGEIFQVFCWEGIEYCSEDLDGIFGDGLAPQQFTTEERNWDQLKQEKLLHVDPTR